MNSRIDRFVSFGLLSLLFAEPGLARWNHEEAKALNQVTGLGTEYYNDILSYRDPLLWDAIWKTSQLGFRSAAGSMNKKDFLFGQAIKIASSKTDPWQLAYTAERLEDPRRVRDNSALELSYGADNNPWRLGLLGEGQSEKAFADLGARFSHESADSLWQVIGWSIDPFYTEKKHQREDYRTRDPWFWDILLQQKWGRSTVRWHHEQDQPIVWYQTSQDQRYAYRQEATNLLWTYEQSDTQISFLQLSRERERESLAALTRTAGQSFVDLRSSLELGQRIQSGRDSHSYSIWGLWAETRLQSETEEAAHDNTWKRQEAAFLWNWSRPFQNGRHDEHWGLVLNQVKLDEARKKRATELKIMWGPDFVLGEHGRLRFNTTWDIDQLVADFPFTKKGFHPWGGGQASFLMVF